MSPANDLGTRHVCWKCGAKFYDLNKPSPACPKCGADPREAQVAKPPKVAKAPPPAPKRAASEDDDDDILPLDDDLAADDEDDADTSSDDDDDGGVEQELY